MAHSSDWEDSETLGVSCNGEYAGIFERGKWKRCPICGKNIMADWEVLFSEADSSS